MCEGAGRPVNRHSAHPPTPAPPPPPRILTFVTAQHKLELAVHRVLAARVGRDRGGGLLLPAHAHARLDPRAPPASHPRAGLQVGRLSSTHRHSCLWRCAGAPPTHLPTPPPTLSTRMYSTPPLSRRPASVLSAPSAPAVQGSRWARSAALTSACVGTRGGGGAGCLGGAWTHALAPSCPPPAHPPSGEKEVYSRRRCRRHCCVRRLLFPGLKTLRFQGCTALPTSFCPARAVRAIGLPAGEGGGGGGPGCTCNEGRREQRSPPAHPPVRLYLSGRSASCWWGGSTSNQWSSGSGGSSLSLISTRPISSSLGGDSASALSARRGGDPAARTLIMAAPVKAIIVIQRALQGLVVRVVHQHRHFLRPRLGARRGFAAAQARTRRRRSPAPPTPRSTRGGASSG